MAINAVAARVEGDVFQSLFFWCEAAKLLVPHSRVVRVDLEHDDADGVDDVAVFYEPPGIEAGGFHATADYYQVKFHVDQREEYTSAAIIDPSFIAARRSLLHRFHHAYRRVNGAHAGFRLHLASNWRWRDDQLGKHLREYDGALPTEFFTSSPTSRIGAIRESWRRHLELDVDEFNAFARCLRFETDHFGRRRFRENVHDRLARAGLRPPSDDHAASSYESLAQRFLVDRRASFDRDAFRLMCEREGLFADESDNDRRLPAVGVRSWLRFAENLEDEAATVVSLVDHFNGRHPKTPASWSTAADELRSAFADPALQKTLRAAEHALLLECHGSLALLTGYELSRNTGGLVYPVQKPGRTVWRPAGSFAGTLWARDEVAAGSDGTDLIVTLSVTHDVRRDVDAFVASADIRAAARLDLRPASGSGPTSIIGADHAAALAAALVDEMRRARPARVGVVHLFAAVPNALLFFLGQYREALGRIQVYEFDFSLERDGSYSASIAIPHGSKEHSSWS